MAISCICELLEEINGFTGVNEVTRFQVYISNLVSSNELKRIPVEYFGHAYVPGGDANTRKRFGKYPKDENGIIIIPEDEFVRDEWYQCTGCGQKWRLIYPDFPFGGYWKKVIEQ